MEFLRKRSTAAVLAAAVILLSTFLGAHRSLNRESIKVSRVFASLQAGALYTCAEGANGLVSVAVNHPEVQAQMTAVRSAREALLREGASVSAVYLAYTDLQSAVRELNLGLESVSLTADEEKRLAAYNSSFDVGVSGVGQSDYNTRVLELSERLTRFPSNILARLTGFEPPELFQQGVA